MRRILVALALATAAGAGAQAAQAAPPPTLTGQQFGGSYYTAVPSDMSLRCDENSDGTTTLVWSTDAETGEMRIRRDAPNGQVDVLALHAEFTLQSATRQVTGTKRLVAPVADVEGIALCEPSSFVVNIAPVDVPYTATITTPDGVFADRGQATHEFRDQSPNLGAPTELHEELTSSLAATEQQHSVLFGKRTPGSSFSAIGADSKQASPFVFYFPGTVRRIHAFIDGKGATSGSQIVRAVLYRRDQTGAPGALIARSFAFTVPASMSARWVPFWLSSTPRLDPGVYWLGLHTGGDNGVVRHAWDPVADSRRNNLDSFADGPSDPFATSLSDNRQLSIFAFGSYGG